MNTNPLKPQKKWIEYISLFSLLLFTISVFSARGFNRPIEAIFILSILFSLKPICFYEKRNNGLWIYLLIAISLLLVFISNGIATATYPNLEIRHSKDSLDYVRILFFVFVGWWVIKHPKIIWVLLVLFSVAFIVKIVFSHQFSMLLSSDIPRLDFGFSNAQHSAAFAGSLLITCISLSPLILKIKNRQFKALACVLTFILLLITLVATLTSQTRAIWFGLFIVVSIAIIPWAILAIGKKSSHIKLKLAIFFAASFSTLLIFTSLNSTISSRVKFTAERVLHYSQLELKDIPPTSMGIRLHQWNLAINLIKKRPISGHGGGSAKYLISISNMPQAAITTFGHFHNSYLELGVGHGLGATFIFIFILGFLFHRLIKSYRDNHIGTEFFFWGISWIIFFGIINIFESYVGSRTGYVLFLIFGGIIYGITSKPYNETENQRDEIDTATTN